MGTKNRLPQPLHTYYIRIINYHWSFTVGHHIATVRFLHESAWTAPVFPRISTLDRGTDTVFKQNDEAICPSSTENTEDIPSRADWPLDNLSIGWTLCIWDQWSFQFSVAQLWPRSLQTGTTFLSEPHLHLYLDTFRCVWKGLSWYHRLHKLVILIDMGTCWKKKCMYDVGQIIQTCTGTQWTHCSIQ